MPSIFWKQCDPLILLSAGDPIFQELKVHGTGIAHYFDRLFLVTDSKEKIITELFEHHKPTDCWFINDKVEETEKIIKKFPHIRPLLKKPNNSKLDFKKTGIPYFGDLVEMSKYITEAKPRHESIGALVFKNNDQKEILVMSRAEKNTLHLPKGTREKGETPEMTITRESKEEANVECLIKNYLISVPSVFTKNNQVYEKITHYYVAEYSGGELKSNDQEHDEVFWLPLSEAKKAFLERGAHIQLGFENEVKVIEAVL